MDKKNLSRREFLATASTGTIAAVASGAIPAYARAGKKAGKLAIRGGQPVLDSPPEIVREVKFGGENGPRPEAAIEDFLLKAQVVEFFDQLRRLGDGVVESLEIKHGLPFRMTVREPARP